MKVSKHFTLDEISCGCGCGECNVDQELLHRLDSLRDHYGGPIVPNSVARCEDHNKKVGGSSTSSHLSSLVVKCTAADIPLPMDSKKRYILIQGAFRTFQRIGIAKTFIHVDVDYTKTIPAEWGY